MVTDADYVVSNMDVNQSLRADNNGPIMEQTQPVVDADIAEDVDEEVDEEIMLEENCSSEPEPEQHPEVFSQTKDYFTESELNDGKKRYNKKKFIKMRSSSRVLARNKIAK